MPQVAEHLNLDLIESESEYEGAPCLYRWRRMMLRVEDRKNLRAHREGRHREEL